MDNNIDKKIEVLFIDDDKWTCDLVKEHVLKINANFTFMMSAPEGLGLLKSNNFDIAFIDFRLDGFCADAILFAIKDLTLKTKIYLLTGYDKKYIIEKLDDLKSVVVDVISKTDIITNIQNVLDSAIEKK